MEDKITEKIAALPEGASYFSLEFFPPKTQQGFTNLHARLLRMSHSLQPLFVNVTWGAGGSTATKSLALADLTQRRLGLTTCLHLTCTNMSRQLIDKTLEDAKQLGIRNILALRGDAPRSEEYRIADKSSSELQDDDSNNHFTYAVDLVKYIRQRYNDHFCIGVAGYPEGHADESHPKHHSPERDLPFLRAKVAAGADFIMTQLFFDVDAQDSYESLLRSDDSGLFKDIPIIPGLMPIQSYQVLKRTTKLSHAVVPATILERLDPVKNDDEAVKRVGVDVLVEMIERLKRTSKNKRIGFHFYTLNLEKAVAQIVERCQLIASSPTQGHPDQSSSAIVVDDETDEGFLIVDKVQRQNEKKRRVSSFANSQPNNRVIVDRSLAKSSRIDAITYEAPDDEAGVPSEQSPETTLAISEGHGSLGREATWDDFPNGRWGDSRSPAYGEIDGYGVSLHMSMTSALKLWSHPRTRADITQIFKSHVYGRLPAIPWSDESLSPETELIRDRLAALIKKGWWTVASQPAVNGVPSSHPIFGWGPPNGFVFQKAFVEFFCPGSDVQGLLTRLDADDQVTYLAANAAGQLISGTADGERHECSLPSPPQSPLLSSNGAADVVDTVNPVTWGAFTGKEIVTPTIIEANSFKAWCEEAFGIWSEWMAVYAPGSESARLLRELRDDVWLVNVIHHGYMDGDALWKVLT